VCAARQVVEGVVEQMPHLLLGLLRLTDLCDEVADQLLGNVAA
jgi:hypothetical protein